MATGSPLATRQFGDLMPCVDANCAMRCGVSLRASKPTVRTANRFNPKVRPASLTASIMCWVVGGQIELQEV